MRDDGVVFPEVPLPLDGLVEECAEDDEEQHVEDAQDGQTARLGVSFGSWFKVVNIYKRVDILFSQGSSPQSRVLI